MNLKNRVRKIEQANPGRLYSFVTHSGAYESIKGQGREWSRAEFEKELAAIERRGDEALVININMTEPE